MQKEIQQEEPKSKYFLKIKIVLFFLNNRTAKKFMNNNGGCV